jgi:hypothetical protein
MVIPHYAPWSSSPNVPETLYSHSAHSFKNEAKAMLLEIVMITVPVIGCSIFAMVCFRLEPH